MSLVFVVFTSLVPANILDAMPWMGWGGVLLGKKWFRFDSIRFASLGNVESARTEGAEAFL